jgi:hypothetical protein
MKPVVALYDDDILDSPATVGKEERKSARESFQTDDG